METLKVGIREFRSHLPHYLLEVGQPVAITRHGETIGYYIPSREKQSEDDLASLKAAAARLDALLEAAQIDTEEVASEFATRRRQK
jgi:antitoxin (DNA-binding transcriptional repressor) of toxin-antitoxin stability system